MFIHGENNCDHTKKWGTMRGNRSAIAVTGAALAAFSLAGCGNNTVTDEQPPTAVSQEADLLVEESRTAPSGPLESTLGGQPKPTNTLSPELKESAAEIGRQLARYSSGEVANYAEGGLEAYKYCKRAVEAALSATPENAEAVAREVAYCGFNREWLGEGSRVTTGLFTQDVEVALERTGYPLSDVSVVEKVLIANGVYEYLPSKLDRKNRETYGGLTDGGGGAKFYLAGLFPDPVSCLQMEEGGRANCVSGWGEIIKLQGETTGEQSIVALGSEIIARSGS